MLSETQIERLTLKKKKASIIYTDIIQNYSWYKNDTILAQNISHYDEDSEIQNKKKKVLMLQDLFIVVESDHFICEQRAV
jgi:hypothetical protein